MNNKDLKSTSRTNWEALDSMSDDDIDYSDIPPLTEEFFEKAILMLTSLIYLNWLMHRYYVSTD